MISAVLMEYTIICDRLFYEVQSGLFDSKNCNEILAHLWKNDKNICLDLYLLLIFIAVFFLENSMILFWFLFSFNASRSHIECYVRFSSMC